MNMRVDTCRSQNQVLTRNSVGTKPDRHHGVTPDIIAGLPLLPMPDINPSLIPTSALITPSLASTIVTLVITESRTYGRGNTDY